MDKVHFSEYGDAVCVVGERVRRRLTFKYMCFHRATQGGREQRCLLREGRVVSNEVFGVGDASGVFGE